MNDENLCTLSDCDADYLRSAIQDTIYKKDELYYMIFQNKQDKVKFICRTLRDRFLMITTPEKGTENDGAMTCTVRNGDTIYSIKTVDGEENSIIGALKCHELGSYMFFLLKLQECEFQLVKLCAKDLEELPDTIFEEIFWKVRAGRIIFPLSSVPESWKIKK